MLSIIIHLGRKFSLGKYDLYYILISKRSQLLIFARNSIEDERVIYK